MNNIHEKDWAEDDGWGCHSGMRSNPYGDDGDDGPDGGKAVEADADLPRGGSESVGRDSGMTHHHPE